MKIIWNSSEIKPDSKRNVLGVVDNRYRTIVFYIKKHSEQAEEVDEDMEHSVDYDEKKEIYYWKEGWYEELEQFSSCYDYVWTSREVNIWTELPEIPKTK